MINNRHALYLQDTLALARTVVIKLGYSAQALNLYMQQLYPSELINYDDPTTWKYYRNIAGLRHSHDPVMTVVSLDDLTTVAFDAATLMQHPQTLQAYQYGTRYYEELLTRYPDMEMLILGVLYAPTDSGFITRAISAADATILYYPDQYIEPTEYDLPSKLQRWCTNYYSTWVNANYCVSDDLYAATILAQMTLHMVPAVMNMRLAACRTPQVHSYHIKEYLASHSGLDRYYDQLTHQQRLFLYRNLPYIRNNAGRKEVFDWLVHNIMTVRILPLYDYTVKHNTYVQLPDNEYPNRLNYTPGLNVVRKALNYDDNNQLTTLKTFDKIVEQMDSSAPGNMVQRTYVDKDVALQFQTHVSSVTATKLVESIALDMSEMVPHPLAEVLLSHWMTWASTGLYTASIPLEINGKINTKTLSAKDCLVLYQYCIAKATGQATGLIRPIVVQRCLKTPSPTLAQVSTLSWASQLNTQQLSTLHALAPTIPHLYTVKDFYLKAYSSYRCGVLQYRYTSTIRDINRNYAAQRISSYYYADSIQTLYTNKTYSTWLQENDIDLSFYNESDYWNLATSIFDQATGMSANAQMSIKEVQRAMIAVLSTLTSYSIQYLSDVDSSKVRLINNPVLLLSDPPKTTYDSRYNELPNYDVLSKSTEVYGYHGDLTYTRNSNSCIVSVDHRVADAKLNAYVKQSTKVTPTVQYSKLPTHTASSADDAMQAWYTLTSSQMLQIAFIS